MPLKLSMYLSKKLSLWIFPFVFVIGIILPSQVNAQSTTVTGKVTGPKGEPLSDVSVLVKGTSTGTSTDKNGNFSLDVANSNATLVITSLDYDRRKLDWQEGIIFP